MNGDIVLNGIHIGEHSFDPDKVIDEIYERCIKPGLNFVTIRTRTERIPQHYFIEWAKYLADNKIYFIFLYTIQSVSPDVDSQFDRETVTEMKRIAGEYFIGDMIGETGSTFACKFPGYYENIEQVKGDVAVDIRRRANVKEAHDDYVKSVSAFIDIDKALGMPDIVSVEATGLNKYNAEAGVTIPMLELMCGSPDVLVSSLRGVARSIDSKLWGTYVAHEWYGGMRHDDTLKRKRLELAYKYAYLAGTNAFCLESGDECIDSYGHAFSRDSEYCEDYRKILCDMMNYIKNDCRPKGGPKVKVAFVSGLHDAYGGWGGSSVWNGFEGEEWGHNEAEHSWRILDEIGTKRTWADIANYGEHDLSTYPAYGMYDIVPIEAPIEKLSEYDYLIFLGWNSMTDENMDKLYEYVKRGGRLLASVAHLNCNTVREGELRLPDASKVEKLFGVRFTGEICRTNNGVKFRYDSKDKNLLYPGSKSLVCDPIYSAGYTGWAKTELCGAYETACVSGHFDTTPSGLAAVIENMVGDGIATLVTSTNYPGHPALLPLYRAIVREMVTASSRNCEIKVLGSDRLRWAVYEGNKVYLLNTDYDMPITIKLIFKGDEKLITLNPLELKSIEL